MDPWQLLTYVADTHHWLSVVKVVGFDYSLVSAAQVACDHGNALIVWTQGTFDDAKYLLEWASVCRGL